MFHTIEYLEGRLGAVVPTLSSRPAILLQVFAKWLGDSCERAPHVLTPVRFSNEIENLLFVRYKVCHMSKK